MNYTPKFKPFQILAAKLLTATTSGTGVNIDTGADAESAAIVVASLGAVTGAPSTTSVVITVEESATSGGTYDTLATFATATGGGEISTLPIIVNAAKPFIRATATITFSGGTSPAVPVDVVVLMAENVASDTNETALS